MYCTSCNGNISGKIYPDQLCQACYNYFRKGGIQHPIPEAGMLVKDNRGYPICHVCGKSYRRIGSHCKEKHGMTIAEYKKQFGLCASCKTTEDSYSATMSKHAYDNNMDKQLLECGKNTRFKTGNKVRLGKEVRLQELYLRREGN